MSTEKIGTDENTLGYRLKTLRLSVRLTQKEFAEKLSVSGGYISDIEKGKANPSGAVISEITTAYRINREWLESGVGPMVAEPKPETPEEKLVRTYGRNPVTKSVAAGWDNEQQLQSKEVEQTIAPDQRAKYRDIQTKFDHVFDFLLEAYEGDPTMIQEFLQKMDKDFLMQNPDYRYWKYEKAAELEEKLKKRREQNHQDKYLSTKSVNGD